MWPVLLEPWNPQNHIIVKTRIFFFDLILTLIQLLSHAELLEEFLSLVDLTRGPHAFTVHLVVCSVRTVGKPQTL